MTASQHLEMLVTHRRPSDLPVRVIEQLIRRPVPAGFARVVVGHLAQGSLAALALTGARLTRRIPAGLAIPVTSVALVVADAALADAIGIGEMPWKWPRRDLGVDLLHKTSLTVTARLLTRTRSASMA